MYDDYERYVEDNKAEVREIKKLGLVTAKQAKEVLRLLDIEYLEYRNYSVTERVDSMCEVVFIKESCK